MYNERTNFSIKNVIVQFLFIALLVFLLIWLFPSKNDLNKLGSTNDSTDLSVLTDRIFNENILMMKDSAKSYYTLERLPQNVGDKTKMTLGEMLDKKIILPFKDKNGKACSLTDSYVEVTKYDTEYLMKVNLKCGKEENYLLVYMGCYDYCKTTVCEKNKSDIKTPVIYKTKKVVTKKTITPSNPTPTKPEPKKPEPNKPEPTKYYCKVVDGKHYDANGNTVSESAYKASCEKKDPEYLYEYSKTIDGKCTESNWSDWSTNEVKASSNTAVQTKTKTTKKLVGYNVKTVTDKSKPIYGTKEVVTGQTTKKVCTSYGYVATGEYSYSDWKEAGTVYLNYTPSNTATVQYIKMDENSWVCAENCTAGTTKAYKKYVKTATPITKYQCTNWQNQTVNNTTKVQVITGYETTTTKTPVYNTTTTKYYRYKTKSCTKASTDIKWSTYNDKSLINNGYSYTGNKKQK